MGSIEVYDYQQMKWVPYLAPPDQSERYYQRLQTQNEQTPEPGYVMRKLQDTEKELKATIRKLDEAEAKLKRGPTVKLVTPVAQSIEMAKSEVKHAEKQTENVQAKGYPTTDWTKLKY